MSKSPIPNLTPLKRSADELSYAIVPYTGDTTSCSGEEEVVVGAQPIGQGIPLPSETAGGGEKECLAARPIGPGIPHNSQIPTVSAGKRRRRRRKKYASSPTPLKRSSTDELAYAIVPYTGGQGIPLCSETLTDPKVTVGAGGKKKKQSVPRPIGPARRKKYGLEIHRRPSWLPVGWSLWRIIRADGHVDSYYYPPSGLGNLRSIKAVFFVLKSPTAKLPPAKEVPEDAEEELEYEVPDEMVTWFGPEAGVTVEFVGDGRLLPGEIHCIDPVPVSEIPPISVKKVRLPVGLRYRSIGNYFKNFVDVKAEPVEVNVVKVEPSE